MIETLIKYENNRIEELGLFDKQFGLAELVEDSSGKTYPLVYLSNGSLKHVTEFSDWLGLSYFRLNGNVTTALALDASFQACANTVEITYPLKFVGTIKRNKLKKDDTYVADRVIQTLKKKIIENSAKVQVEIGAKKVSFFVTSETSDRKEIVADEYPGIEGIKINWEYIYISLNIEAKVLINTSCISDYCGDILVDEDNNELIDQNNNELEAQS